MQELLVDPKLQVMMGLVAVKKLFAAKGKTKWALIVDHLVTIHPQAHISIAVIIKPHLIGKIVPFAWRQGKTVGL